jgi:hypothetical protein
MANSTTQAISSFFLRPFPNFPTSVAATVRSYLSTYTLGQSLMAKQPR